MKSLLFSLTKQKDLFKPSPFRIVSCWISIILTITPSISWAQDPFNLRDNRNEIRSIPVPTTPPNIRYKSTQNKELGQSPNELPLQRPDDREGPINGPIESTILGVRRELSSRDGKNEEKKNKRDGEEEKENQISVESNLNDTKVTTSADSELAEDPVEELSEDLSQEKNEADKEEKTEIKILIDGNIVSNEEKPSAEIQFEAKITNTEEQNNPGPEEQQEKQRQQEPVPEKQPVNQISPNTNQPNTVPPFIFNVPSSTLPETVLLPESRAEEVNEEKPQERETRISMPVSAKPLPTAEPYFDFSTPNPLAQIKFEADEIAFLDQPNVISPIETLNNAERLREKKSLVPLPGQDSPVYPEVPAVVFGEKISNKDAIIAVPTTEANIFPSWLLWKRMEQETEKRVILKWKSFRFLQESQEEDSGALLTLKVPSIEGVNLRVKQIFEMTPAELEQLALLLGVPSDQIGILIGKLLQILAHFEGVDLRTLTSLPVLITFLKEETSETLFSGGVTPQGWLFGINKEFSDLIKRLKTQESSQKVVSVFSQVLLLTGLGQSLLPPDIVSKKGNPQQISRLAKQLLERLAREAGLSMSTDQLWNQFVGAAQSGKILSASETLLLAKKPTTQPLDVATYPRAGELIPIEKRMNRLAKQLIEAGRLVEEGLANDRGFAVSQREALLRKAKKILKPAHSELQTIKVQQIPKNLEDKLTGLLKDQTTLDFLIDQSFRSRRADGAARQARLALVKVFESKTAGEAQAQLKIAQNGQEVVQKELTDLVDQPAWIRETVPRKLTDGAVENLSLLRDELNRIVTKVERLAAEKDFKETRPRKSDDSADWMNWPALHPARAAQ